MLAAVFCLVAATVCLDTAQQANYYVQQRALCTTVLPLPRTLLLCLTALATDPLC
jgi:hypothetical protein